MDGNTAALSDYLSQQDRRDAVYRAHESTAREILAEEAWDNLPQALAEIAEARYIDVRDALIDGDTLLLGTILKHGFESYIESYVEDNLDDKVWELDRD